MGSEMCIRDSLDAMASAADKVLAGSPDDGAVSTPLIAAVAAPSKDPEGLCVIHSKWGKDAYSCADPSSCKLRMFTRPRPPRPPRKSSAGKPSGNGAAGKQ